MSCHTSNGTLIKFKLLLSGVNWGRQKKHFQCMELLSTSLTILSLMRLEKNYLLFIIDYIVFKVNVMLSSIVYNNFNKTKKKLKKFSQTIN